MKSYGGEGMHVERCAQPQVCEGLRRVVSVFIRCPCSHLVVYLPACLPGSPSDTPGCETHRAAFHHVTGDSKAGREGDSKAEGAVARAVLCGPGQGQGQEQEGVHGLCNGEEERGHHHRHGHGHTHGHAIEHGLSPSHAHSSHGGDAKGKQAGGAGGECDGASPHHHHHHHQQQPEPHRNINLQGAYLHVLGDLLQSLGVMIGGAVIWRNPDW